MSTAERVQDWAGPQAPDFGARRLFTAAEFWRMAEAGIFSESERVELIDGEIIMMPPQDSQHAGCVSFLMEFFAEQLAGRAMLRAQMPLPISRHGSLEPDFAVLKRRDDHYRRAHPSPGDVLLVIEVSNTTLRQDLEQKGVIYAEAGIPEYWVADVKNRVLHIFLNPSSAGYQRHEVLAADLIALPACFPDVKLPVKDLLGA